MAGEIPRRARLHLDEIHPADLLFFGPGRFWQRASEARIVHVGIALGPDGKLYVINGNYTPAPKDLSPRSPHRNYREDLLLPRQWDATG